MTTPTYRPALEDVEAANYGTSFRRRSSSRNINQPDAEAIAIPMTQPKVPSTTQTPYAQGKFYTVKTDLRNDLTSHESDTFALIGCGRLGSNMTTLPTRAGRRANSKAEVNCEGNQAKGGRRDADQHPIQALACDPHRVLSILNGGSTTVLSAHGPA